MQCHQIHDKTVHIPLVTASFSLQGQRPVNCSYISTTTTRYKDQILGNGGSRYNAILL